MSTKDYILSLNDLEVWNDAVKNMRKLKKDQAITSDTNLKNLTDCYVINNKQLIQYAVINQHDNVNDAENKIMEFGDSSKINSRMLKSIKKGNYKIDKTLDLHGYSKEEAYKELTSFLNNAYEQKYRMVLIITGKGNNSFEKQAVLKSSLLDWLTTYSLNDKFLYVNYAHPKHGGDGAVYVVLKKPSIRIKKSY